MESEISNKIYITRLDQDTFACKKCGLVRKINVAKLLNDKKLIKIRCRCNELYEIEFREKYRKKVSLAAKYKILTRPGEGEAIIEDISMGGIGLTVLSAPRFEINDLLRLGFSLDDERRTRVSLDVRVKYISGHKVGTQIHDWHYYQKEIGFYLLP